MGFDIYGLAARSKKGEYFRNNVWWWRPLAEYVLGRVDVPREEARHWDSNDRQEVSARTALLIADTLDRLIASGETARYEREYRRQLKALPLQECDVCGGSGERHDEIVDGRCNGCDGRGQVKNWSCHYPFSVENVREFAEFCRESGGFQIC